MKVCLEIVVGSGFPGFLSNVEVGNYNGKPITYEDKLGNHG